MVFRMEATRVPPMATSASVTPAQSIDSLAPKNMRKSYYTHNLAPKQTTPSERSPTLSLRLSSHVACPPRHAAGNATVAAVAAAASPPPAAAARMTPAAPPSSQRRSNMPCGCFATASDASDVSKVSASSGSSSASETTLWTSSIQDSSSGPAAEAAEDSTDHEGDSSIRSSTSVGNSSGSEDEVFRDRAAVVYGTASAAASTATSAASPSGFASNSSGGLFRSPTTGSVQSATSAHGLPDPAVAVRNLICHSRTAHLCTIMSRMHHRRKGYPFGSLVDFATDDTGHPVFALSPLAIHTRNLLADPRCTLVVQMPGWSGLANARVTLFGDVYPLPQDQQAWALELYRQRHEEGASQLWGNFHFFRMSHICDIYFVGGFGTVTWVDANEYAAAQPDRIATGNPERTLQVLNDKFSTALRDFLAASEEGGGAPADEVAFISIDKKGLDVRVRRGTEVNVQRLSFDSSAPIDTPTEAEVALQRLLQRGGGRD